ncbi:hypothetical protein [Streptomyces pratensis]|uniref:hypothetical protein n=1 Tax=Streptomyces pratensis TaxID=1169025 RepID=UPI00193343DD|nr:hypothetical protein [Streptomyces pratensis]
MRCGTSGPAHPVASARAVSSQAILDGEVAHDQGGQRGLHTPEAVIDPAYAVERLMETGAAFVGATAVS